jgi:cytochrome c oxidase subunit 2
MIFSRATGLSGSVVNNVFFSILVICVFLLGLITFLMVYFAIRYRREKNPTPTDIEGSTLLEIVWTVVPTLLVLGMFYYGLTGFEFLKKVPPGAMVVKVIARQWSWLFEYPNGLKAEELKVPVGKPVKLLLTSADVIHGFYAPAFRIKQDAVPGMETYLWFQPTEAGAFDVLCTQYCGLEHARMLTKIVALPEKDFMEWYQKGAVEAKVPPRGVQLFQEKGCKACHSTDGTPLLGPTVKGLFRKKVTGHGGKERTVVAGRTILRNRSWSPVPMW